ncbi:MAG TPA: hypothetical protein VGG24_10265, partial [Paraburkholderia sp.]
MSDELNRPSGPESSEHVPADAQHADLYDVPPTPQRDLPGDALADPPAGTRADVSAVAQASPTDAANAAGRPGAESIGERAKPDHPDGFPDLNRHRQDAGSMAKRWLGILAFVVVTLVGAIWAVHRVVSLHEAQAKHARDAASDKPVGGRSFDTTVPAGDAVARASSAASGTAPLSAIGQSAAASAVQAATPSNVRAGMPSGGQTPHPAASWYDADLMVGAGDTGDAAAGLGTVSGAGGSAQGATPAAATVAATSSQPSVLTAALTPTQLRAAQASLTENRDLRLSAGAKIPCAGDTAFDSTLAGISTCTVTSD